MKEVFPRLAAGREPAGAVRPGIQAPLHGLRDVLVFLLDAVPQVHAGLVARLGLGAHVREVEIEDHHRLVHPERHDEIGVITPSYQFSIKFGYNQ